MATKDKKKEESEYNYTPPSLTRKTVDPFIKAEHSQFWLAIWNFTVNILLRRRFYSIRVKNAHHYDLRDKDVACIYYSQHSCWWDGMVAYYLCKYLFNDQINMMVEDLIKFPLLGKVGAFSIDKKTPKTTLRSMKYCADFLNKEKISLWLFPQGVIMPPNHRPLEFQKGVGFLAQRVKRVNLFPIAIQYVFLRQGLPEVLIDIGKPITVNGEDVDKDKFTEFLENDFTKVLDNQLKEISNGEIEKYKILYKKWDGVGKHIEKWIRNRL